MKPEIVEHLQKLATPAGTLPSIARTREGVEFNPQDVHWYFRDGLNYVSIDRSVFDCCHPIIAHGFSRVLLHYLEKGAAATAQNYYVGSAIYVRRTEAKNPGALSLSGELHLSDYVAFRNSGEGIGAIKSVLRKWAKLGIPGIQPELEAFLKSSRDKGHAKGVAVANMSTHDGPFTELEYSALQDGINKAFSENKLTPSLFLQSWLFMTIGCRPIQLAALKLKDLIPPSEPGGDCILKVPRVKGQGQLRRTIFKDRLVPPQLAKVLLPYADAVRAAMRSRFESAPDEAPLFPAKAEEEWTTGLEWHQAARQVGQGIALGLEKLGVVSHRTGKPMSISAIRFRRTFGTRAAQEGHGALVLAELLDHSDTQHVGVYIATLPDIVARIDKAVALELAPLAQAFMGKGVLTSEAQATRAGDPTSRIVDPSISSDTLANCGQSSFCGAGAKPLPCYTCASFEPWMDGPHEAVLDFLIERRARQMGEISQRIASINDKTIFAVAHVIILCKQAQENHSKNGSSSASQCGSAQARAPESGEIRAVVQNRIEFLRGRN